MPPPADVGWLHTAQRLKLWYESGMAETYLYVCLVDVFEDHLREGVVLYAREWIGS